MVIPYSDAIKILRREAAAKSEPFAQDGETMPIKSAVGSICRDTYYSPLSTPLFDSSAMDGFAVNSEATSTASPDNPVIFQIQDTIAAGDQASSFSAISRDGFVSCVEIMTGAQFPKCSDAERETFFNACIKVEDTSVVTGHQSNSRFIQIIKPVHPGQNRRLAGSDFRDQDLILRSGTTIDPNHVMALAALGIRDVTVYRKLRIGFMSTGNELMSHDDIDLCGTHRIRDSNGPYIHAVLTGLGVETVDMGILQDHTEDFVERMTQTLSTNQLDVIITTGAVSMGKFDFVAEALELLGADILFHKVAMRPGHPVLVAKFPPQPSALASPSSPTHRAAAGTAFFGLPGNPLAAAVCLRFLVLPYLRALHGSPLEESCCAAVLNSGFGTECKIPKFSTDLQTYCHGKYDRETNGVVLSKDQSSSKIKPLLEANCWVEIPACDDEVLAGSVVKIYEIYPSSLGR